MQSLIIIPSMQEVAISDWPCLRLRLVMLRSSQVQDDSSVNGVSDLFSVHNPCRSLVVWHEAAMKATRDFWQILHKSDSVSFVALEVKAVCYTHSRRH